MAIDSFLHFTPSSTVGQLRQQFGAHLAAGYDDQEPLSVVLSRAGVSTVQEYVEQQEKGHSS